jgi:hypothetical protein
MSYRPDEAAWMAYLYNEMTGEEKEKMEQYLATNPEAAKELASMQALRKMLGTVRDKEVIAPPIVIGETQKRFFWNSSAFRTSMSIAASLVMVILVGRIAGTEINYANNELSIRFGGTPEEAVLTPAENSTLTAQQVQEMINQSVAQNNSTMQASWSATEKRLDQSVKNNLAMSSYKVNELVKQASLASQDEIRKYVAGLQTDNQQLVKDYFQLTANQQKDYIEDLLVDFAQYLQQQRNNDLQTLQTRLSSIEQNTSVFKQETEQILASIISSTNVQPVTTTKY